MNNYTKFPNKNIAIILKYLFHISNILLIIFYLYQGSIFGCFIYKDCGIQPQLTGDFVGNSISSNHFYIFSVISLLGFIVYSKKKNIFNYNNISIFNCSFFGTCTHNYTRKRLSSRRSSWKYFGSSYIIDYIFNI